ncbi:hypothetical protein F4810DRAFT_667640 [Camillea tinctor]|nr:hypothetical protein F4810DRAFT_667640 [Camillea tinctor]
MCNQVWTRFLDCQHKEYQNTFPCHVARRCRPDDDMLLAEPVFLPTAPPSIPPGMLNCQIRTATRPSRGFCLECRKKERAKKLSSSSSSSSSSASATTNPATTTPTKQMTTSGSSSSFYSSNSSTTHRVASPSPDPRALERVRQSFISVAAQQRSVSQSPAGAQEREQNQDRNQGRVTSYGWSTRPGTRTRE